MIFSAAPLSANVFSDGSLERQRDWRATRGFGTSDYYFIEDPNNPGKEIYMAEAEDVFSVNDLTSLGVLLNLWGSCSLEDRIENQSITRVTMTDRLRAFGDGWVGADYKYEDMVITYDEYSYSLLAKLAAVAEANVTLKPSTLRSIRPRRTKWQ